MEKNKHMFACPIHLLGTWIIHLCQTWLVHGAIHTPRTILQSSAETNMLGGQCVLQWSAAISVLWRLYEGGSQCLDIEQTHQHTHWWVLHNSVVGLAVLLHSHAQQSTCPMFACKGRCCSGGCGITLCWFQCTNAISCLHAREGRCGILSTYPPSPEQ